MPDEVLSTAEVAVATGYSAQQIRDLVRLAVLAPAERAANGYRRFAAVHVRDLHAYRELAAAVDPATARAVMIGLRREPIAEAVDTVSRLHTVLVAKREQALLARAALRSIAQERADDARPAPEDAMTITELSGALGVRASTLRFWERERLIAAERSARPPGSARRYTVEQVRTARIVAALRAAGHRIPEVREAVDAMRSMGDVAASDAALTRRIDAIAARQLALLRAGSTLAMIISESAEVGEPQRTCGCSETAP